MPIVSATYVTREELKVALDVLETARADDQIDRAITSATEAVDGCLLRHFTPWVGTRYYPWPDLASPTPWRLWIDDTEVISVSSLNAGGTTITNHDYFLEPANHGPPFSSIEIDQASSAAFTSGATRQRAIEITGTFGYTDTAEPVGVLAGTLAGSAGATASVTWSTPRIGVGALLRIDDERVLVTGRGWSSSGQTILSPLLASSASVTLSVTDGSAFAAEELLLVDSERMRVVDVAGNNLTVKRAWDGSVLATHSGSTTIYTMTSVTLARAQQGTSLASHDVSASITRWVPPQLIADLALAEALTQLMQERAGYARVAGSAEYVKEVTGRGLEAIRSEAQIRHGRQLRAEAI